MKDSQSIAFQLALCKDIKDRIGKCSRHASMLRAAATALRVYISPSASALTSKCASPYLIHNRKRSETASALAQGVRGGTNLEALKSIDDSDRLQLDALLLWLLLLL